MASVEVFSSGTRWALKTAAQLAEVVKNISPSKIMITHEGHSWERVAFSAVRDINPKIFCIGYQHSTIAYLQHALKRDLLPKYNPDFVYTSGATGANLLKRYHQKKTQFLAVLGSPRPIVSRQLILNDSSIVSAQKQFCCLVLPEGIIDECNVLFEFSMKCALQNPSVQFIWRLHPNMSYDEVVRQNPKFKNLPTNIYISNRTFEEDIKKSQISLYRGSTAIIGAVMSGIFPIYLNQPEEISIDTLWELDSNFRCVSTTYEFKNILKSMMLKNKSNQTLSVIRRAQALCQALLLPMDSVQLVKRLKHDDKIATK
jgi:hypothetical protein